MRVHFDGCMLLTVFGVLSFPAACCLLGLVGTILSSLGR